MALAEHNAPPEGAGPPPDQAGDAGAARRATAPFGSPRRAAPARGEPWYIHPRVASFRYAFAGVAHLLRTQRNAQIHSVAGVVVVTLGWVFAIERAEWLALIVTITLVLAAEGVNTAIEAVVDLASPDHHPLAKVAKDVGAGTVLITAVGAVAVGLLIFLPRVWRAIAPLLGL